MQTTPTKTTDPLAARRSHALRLAGVLAARGGPVLSTPCGVLAPLHTALGEHRPVQTIAREDSAVGIAVGAALAGRRPVVLMQNSGLGQSVNALASLLVPAGLDVLVVVGMRGTGEDTTEENLGMGRLTTAVLDGLGAEHRTLDPPPSDPDPDGWAAPRSVARFLLVPPSTFGWAP